MLNNYLKTAIRNFARHKVHTFINIFGLTIGMACTLLILLYVNYEMSYDGFQANRKNLFRVNKVAYENGELNYKSAYTFAGQGRVMKNEIPEVVDYVRLLHSEGVLRFDKPGNDPVSFREKDMYYADENFFNMFSYRLVRGEKKSALSKPNSIVLSESEAKKFFGSENPIEKIVHFQGSDFIVTGIFQDVPPNTHLIFSALMSFNTLKINDQDSWTNHAYYTYVLLKDNTDPLVVEPKLSKAFDKYMYKYFDRKFVTNHWNLQRVDRIYLYSTDFTSISMEYGSYKTVLYLFIIAFLVLIIAWVNFINHSTARLPDRAKEIGIRKTVGASQKQLIKQFVTETAAINFAAIIISVVIAESSLNWLNSFLGIYISFFRIQGNLFWGAWLLLLLIGVLLTSIYPALWISSISTTSVINKRLITSTGSNLLRKFLITFQFSISIALIIITLVMYSQISFTMKQDLGMNINSMLVIKAPGFSNRKEADLAYERFKQTLAAFPGIRCASMSSSVPGERFGSGNLGEIYKEGSSVKNNYFRIGRIDSNFISLYNMKLLSGHDLINESENQNAVIINQESMKLLGFQKPEEAVNQFIRWNGRLIKIIGVVRNFHQESFHKTIEPIVLYDKALDQYIDYLSIKLDEKNVGDQLPVVEKTFKAIFPGQPFDYFFLDDYFNKQYQKDVQTGKLISAFAFLAVLIAVLGLFNLVSYSAVKRTKEIGVRKVIGATTFNIVALLTKDFIIWILVANLIAWPVAYHFMNKWLQDFAYRIEISWWIFVLSGGIALLIALLTVSYQAIKAAVANPIESLRYE
jgi:putative ABC transport system permease protein